MRFFAVFLGLLAFALQPATAASSPHLASLEQQLRALVGSQSSDVGVAALDLSTGETVSINGETAFPMASTVKVAVAAAYLSQVDHGRRSLYDKISGQSAYRLMERMMIHSDNRATDILIRDLGGPKGLQDWVRFNGLQNLRVDRTIARLLAAFAIHSIPFFQYPPGDGRVAPPPRQGQCPETAESVAPHGPDGPLRDGEKPHPRTSAMGNASREQAGDAEQLHERRRLHHAFERPAHRGRLLRPRRFQSPADHRGGGPYHL